jgi:AmpD protein
LEGEIFELAQYHQLASVCQALQTRYPIGHVVGHEHIARGRKFDPGLGFDWPLLMKTVGWPHQCFPALSF